MTVASEDPAYSKNVLEMVTVASDYCRFLESSAFSTKELIVEYLQKVCPLLYLKGALLPEIIPENEETIERFVTQEEWETIFNDLRSKFGKDDNFYRLDPNESADYEPILSSLSENFADIYQDLKDFILLYSKTTHTSKENAVTECRYFFEIHWGPRILAALPVLHQLLYLTSKEDDTPAF